MLALNSNMGRTNLTRVGNINSLFVTKWNKIIWIDTYVVINLTNTSITVFTWNLSPACIKEPGIWWRPASLTQFTFFRDFYLLACRGTPLTDHSLCSHLPAHFCQLSVLQVWLQVLSLEVCRAGAVQGFSPASPSAFFRVVSLLSFSNYPPVKVSDCFLHQIPGKSTARQIPHFRSCLVCQLLCHWKGTELSPPWIQKYDCCTDPHLLPL